MAHYLRSTKVSHIFLLLLQKLTLLNEFQPTIYIWDFLETNSPIGAKPKSINFVKLQNMKFVLNTELTISNRLGLAAQ